MKNVKRHPCLLSNHLFLAYRAFPFSLQKILLKKPYASSEVEQKEFSERDVKTCPSPALNKTYSPVTHYQLCWLFSPRSLQRLLARVQLCSFCISQGNCEYVYTAQNRAGSRMATSALQTLTSKIKQFCLWEVLHYFGRMLPLLQLYHLWHPYLGQVSCTVVHPICICYTFRFPLNCISWVLPHLLVRRNLGVPHIHKCFLKKNKLSLPAAPEFPFNPGTEESFSSLSGWNVSVLAL